MKFWLGLFLLMLAWSSHAQTELEIVTLENRAVSEILPVIRPLVEPGGTATGMNNQLILRSSRRNLDQIREVIARLDVQPRRLVISVSNDVNRQSERQGVVVSGRLQPGNSSMQGRAYDTTRTGSEQTSQRLQVLEGGSGYIHVGQSLPVPLRQVVFGAGGAVISENVVYRDLGSGFNVSPRVAGDRVTLDITPHFDSPAGRGAANIQRMGATVSGRLGEWIELGGSSQNEQGGERGYTRYSTHNQNDQRSVWLKVEEIR